MGYPGPGKQFALPVGSEPVDCAFCTPHRIFVGLGRIFGHLHLSAGAVIDGARFQCLGELGYCSVIRRDGRPARLYSGPARICAGGTG